MAEHARCSPHPPGRRDDFSDGVLAWRHQRPRDRGASACVSSCASRSHGCRRPSSCASSASPVAISRGAAAHGRSPALTRTAALRWAASTTGEPPPPWRCDPRPLGAARRSARRVAAGWLAGWLVAGRILDYSLPIYYSCTEISSSQPASHPASHPPTQPPATQPPSHRGRERGAASTRRQGLLPARTPRRAPVLTSRSWRMPWNSSRPNGPPRPPRPLLLVPLIARVLAARARVVCLALLEASMRPSVSNSSCCVAL